MNLDEYFNNQLVTTGGPAFPGENEMGHQDPGMDMRDYFAAKVLCSIISAQNCSHMSDQQKANYSYQVADKMLKARLSDDANSVGNQDISAYKEAIDRLQSAYEYIKDADYFTSCLGSKDDLLDSIGEVISASKK